MASLENRTFFQTESQDFNNTPTQGQCIWIGTEYYGAFQPQTRLI